MFMEDFLAAYEPTRYVGLGSIFLLFYAEQNGLIACPEPRYTLHAKRPRRNGDRGIKDRHQLPTQLSRPLQRQQRRESEGPMEVIRLQPH